MTARTVAFGNYEAPVEVPYEDGGIAWDEHLVFPGLDRGEHLENAIELAPRAPILAADGTPLAEGEAEEREHPIGSAAIDVTGEVGSAEEEDLPALERQGFSPTTPVGVSGLEQAFNARLAGQARRLAARGHRRRLGVGAGPRQGQAAAGGAGEDDDRRRTAGDQRSKPWAGSSGGVAVLDARSGEVRALAGQAYSAPQPPGSTFKMITTTAALEKGVVSLDDEFEYVSGVNVGGRFIENANGEICGGTFRQAFAESCNADFAPLGPKIGNDMMVETAERFGFNSPPTLYAPKIVRDGRTRRVEHPRRRRRRPRPRGQRDRPGRSAGDALCRWRASRRRSATTGYGSRTRSSRTRSCGLTPKPVRVMSKKIADELTELMIGVVTEGTGTAGAIPEAQVAGKTGTAELGPEPGTENRPTRSRSKTPGSRPSRPPTSRRLRSGCC